MYVTRPLSLYRDSPTALEEQPPAGPYSGYLVITDEEAEAQDTFCFGACKRKAVERRPFPQDRIVNIVHFSEIEGTMVTKVWFIPVLDQPLSSNRYYVIRAKGRYKGQACASSRETDMGLCCFENVIRDKKPKPFDHRNIYQQFKVHRHLRHSFFASSLAIDGIPPKLLRKKGWELRISRMYQFRLSDALGLDASLRGRLPDFNFPIYNRRSASVLVGQWYCPFIFVREEPRLRHQMRKSIFYKMTLEQWWQQIYSCENVEEEDQSIINISTDVQREVNLISGMHALKDDKVSKEAFWWFRARDQNSGGRKMVSVGLSVAIVEKMRWIQEEGGWVRGGEREVKVQRREEIRSENRWRRFACYILVESFFLRRMNGTLALRCDFRHTQNVKFKWE
ncbi:hypothetical protein SLA2020_152670 [Shorea laevis]